MHTNRYTYIIYMHKYSIIYTGGIHMRYTSILTTNMNGCASGATAMCWPSPLYDIYRTLDLYTTIYMTLIYIERKHVYVWCTFYRHVLCIKIDTLAHSLTHSVRTYTIHDKLTRREQYDDKPSHPNPINLN